MADTEPAEARRLMRFWGALVAVVLVAGTVLAWTVATAQDDAPICWDLYDADGARVGWVVEPYGAPPLSCTAAPVCLDFFDREARRGVLTPIGAPPASCEPAPTSTTLEPTTSSTTVPPSSTTTPSTTTSTTTTVAPPTTQPSAAFVDTFTDGETWRNRWDLDVHHRGDKDTPPTPPAADIWRADHDMNCGGADTFRGINARGDRTQHFYRCAPSGDSTGHVMSSMGDVDGYSVLSMAPKQTFSKVRRVCWDQNVTDLGGRAWTEVVVVPAATVADGDLTHVNPEFVGVDNTTKQHTAQTFGALFNGEYAGLRVFANGVQTHNPYFMWGKDTAGQQSRAIRRQHCIEQVTANTVRITIDQGVDGFFTQTVTGHFPTNARVILEQHAYTPDKDGEACRTVGALTGCRYTWHWDNVVVDT